MAIIYYAYIANTSIMLVVLFYEAIQLILMGRTKVSPPIYCVAGTALILFWPVVLFALAVTVLAIGLVTLILGG